jgi:hypothetical protein
MFSLIPRESRVFEGRGNNKKLQNHPGWRADESFFVLISQTKKIRRLSSPNLIILQLFIVLPSLKHSRFVWD